MKLSKAKLHRPLAVVKVGGSPELRQRLLDMGFTPGARVSIVGAAPMGDPLVISVRGFCLALKKADAALIEVNAQ